MVRRLSQVITTIEETILALLLAGMTIVAFAQVVARYVFNTGWVSALELTTLMFAWMILFGMSYGIKIGAHLGVDVFIKLLPRPLYRGFAVIGALACVLYAGILLESGWLKLLSDDLNARGGAVDYVTKMYQIGIVTEDLEVPRWLAYIILPVGLALFAFRAIQAIWMIITGERDLIIAGHEAEDLVEEHKAGKEPAS